MCPACPSAATDEGHVPERFLGVRNLVLAGAVSWAVHPMRTETVLWASCQSYLLASFFTLLMLLAYALSLTSHPRRDRSCCFGADRCRESKDASHGRAGGASRNRTGATQRSTTGLREHWTFLFRLVAGRVSVSIILSLTFLLAVLCKAATLPALGVLVVFRFLSYSIRVRTLAVNISTFKKHLGIRVIFTVGVKTKPD